MALSGDNSRIAISTKYNKLIVQETESGRLIYESFGNVSTFDEPKFSFENNKILWMASSDRLLRLDLLEGKIELFWEGSPIHAMISDMDRRRIYLGCRDGTVRILGLPRNKVK